MKHVNNFKTKRMKRAKQQSLKAETITAPIKSLPERKNFKRHSVSHARQDDHRKNNKYLTSGRHGRI